MTFTAAGGAGGAAGRGAAGATAAGAGVAARGATGAAAGAAAFGAIGTIAPSQPLAAVAGVHVPLLQHSEPSPFFHCRLLWPERQLSLATFDPPAIAAPDTATAAMSIATLESFIVSPRFKK